MRGRFLTDADVSEDPVMVVLNQAAATRYWGTDDPVGGFGRLGSRRHTLAGRRGGRRREEQRPGRCDGPGGLRLQPPSTAANPARFVVRSTLSAERCCAGIRRAIHDVDPTLPIHDVTTVEEVMKGSLAAERVSAGLSGGFALTALLMAMLGIYGVVSYAVRQRTVEIGTRMAIGASSRDILRPRRRQRPHARRRRHCPRTVVVLGASPWIVRVLELHTFSWSSFFGSAAWSAWSRRARPACRPGARLVHAAAPRRARRSAGDLGHRCATDMRRAMAALSRRIPFTRAGADVVEHALLAGFVDAARRAGFAGRRDAAGARYAPRADWRVVGCAARANPGPTTTCARATSPTVRQPLGPVFSMRAGSSRRLSAYGQALVHHGGDLDAALRWSASTIRQ